MEEDREKKKEIQLLDLPEGCICHILSLTSPVYVLRSSLVCKLFRSITRSDLVWEKFLPFDYPQIDRSSTSAKDIVLHLCRSFMLLEGGNKVKHCQLCWFIHGVLLS